MSVQGWRTTFRPLAGYEPVRLHDELRGDAWMFSPIEVEFDRGDDLIVTIEVAAKDEVPTCRAFSVRSRSGGGLERQTTTLARGIKLRDLLEMAAGAATMGMRQEFEGGVIHSWNPSAEPGTDLGQRTRRRREPVTDEGLREFAQAYREHYERGQMEAFARRLDRSPRHVWRMKRLAIERGFLSEGEGV